MDSLLHFFSVYKMNIFSPQNQTWETLHRQQHINLTDYNVMQLTKPAVMMVSRTEENSQQHRLQQHWRTKDAIDPRRKRKTLAHHTHQEGRKTDVFTQLIARMLSFLGSTDSCITILVNFGINTLSIDLSTCTCMCREEQDTTNSYSNQVRQLPPM